MGQSIDKDLLKEKNIEVAKNAHKLAYPVILTDDRFEDAFKKPIPDENDYCEFIPAIWNDYEYGKCGIQPTSVSSYTSQIRKNPGWHSRVLAGNLLKG